MVCRKKYDKLQEVDVERIEGEKVSRDLEIGDIVLSAASGFLVSWEIGRLKGELQSYAMIKGWRLLQEQERSSLETFRSVIWSCRLSVTS